MDELVQDYSLATFGCDSENVFEEKIRKASALTADFFSTNLNPYKFGIVDAVAQELLPSIVRAESSWLWSVEASLQSSTSWMYIQRLEVNLGQRNENISSDI